MGYGLCVCCKTKTLISSRANYAQTINIRHAGLLHSHLPYIINHDRHLSCFMQLVNRMTAQVLASCDPLSLSECQGHSRWIQTIEFSCIVHHTKFEINRFTSVPTQESVCDIFHQISSAEFSPMNITCAK